MKLKLSTRWQISNLEQTDIEPLLFRLLTLLEQGQSLRQATLVENVSYRHAWGVIKKWESTFAQPLLKTHRGRSGRNELTQFSTELLRQYQRIHQTYSTVLSDEAEQINRSLGLDSPTNRSTIRFFASHDLAVNQLVPLIKRDLPQDLLVQTHGSLESIKLLAQEKCDIAGFHFPLNHALNDMNHDYQRWLAPMELTVMQLAIRTQGMMISKKNPKQIKQLSDLCKRSVRFINRQVDSGTRILFDALLHQKNISPKDINGYQQEEFTHLAVAAMIASGAVDVGMGIEAAAQQFNLGFIPLVKERYVLAFGKNTSPKTIEFFSHTLNSKEFKETIDTLKSYDFSDCGQQLSINTLFD